MRFPLADWIDDHEGIRHNLAVSGMRGALRHPEPSPREVRAADEKALRRTLADLFGVATDRLFLTHGATEANALVLSFLARTNRGRPLTARLRYPEYPSLFETAEWMGFRVRPEGGSPLLAVLSNPRNPEGSRWSRAEVLDWSGGARSLLIDETFREFADAPPLHDLHPTTWTTGTFTKVYGGDDLRVGYVIVPESSGEPFARFHGLVADEIANYSVAGALAALGSRERILAEVRRILAPGFAAFREAFPSVEPPAVPLYFDRALPEPSDPYALRLLSRSVLVCPGRFFRDPSGVRLCFTRTSSAEDLAEYARVRASFATAGSPAAGPLPPTGGGGRARAGRA